MTNAVTLRETSVAVRRRAANADRARDWRKRQREAEAARQAELDALRTEVTTLKAERDRLQGVFARMAASDMIDEDIVRALVRLGGLCRDAAGPLAIARPTVAVRDVVAAASLIRCGGKEAGQAAYDAARGQVLERLSQFLPPPGEA
ncbi:hypothetical protein MPAR168_00535 [Methylorubrum populi]|uniref:BZIP domain-containing protein n=1 Tax=Methylobacterium radiotolerans TaxID=31998 RepID=A0ABU7T8C4_9HYPH